MPIELVAVESIEGLVLPCAPVGGVVWTAGALLGLRDGRVAWSRALGVPPRLAASGRRAYVAHEDVLSCLDTRTGAEVWSEPLDARADALAAHRDGVLVAMGSDVRGFAPDGRAEGRVEVGFPVAELVVSATARYAGGAQGVWKIEPGARVTRLTSRPCIRLSLREEGIQALVGGTEGTALLEDGGLPLAWSFPDADRHLLAPYGPGEWAVAPRDGATGVWVVDRSVHPRWRLPLPGRAHALTVLGPTVAVLLEDDGAVLALTHPDVSSPLLLAVPGALDLFAADGALYLPGGGLTRVYRLRES
jgi:outer membrane protein assembly factor BamB